MTINKSKIMEALKSEKTRELIKHMNNNMDSYLSKLNELKNVFVSNDEDKLEGFKLDLPNFSKDDITITLRNVDLPNQCFLRILSNKIEEAEDQTKKSNILVDKFFNYHIDPSTIKANLIDKTLVVTYKKLDSPVLNQEIPVTIL